VVEALEDSEAGHVAVAAQVAFEVVMPSQPEATSGRLVAAKVAVSTRWDGWTDQVMRRPVHPGNRELRPRMHPEGLSPLEIHRKMHLEARLKVEGGLDPPGSAGMESRGTNNQLVLHPRRTSHLE
jgi:hypothetical protein